jgi:hypothetical protein
LGLGAGLARLAQRMTAEVAPELVWVIDDTGFPKKGQHSLGVARQYLGTLDKTANCQVAVSLHQLGAEESTILRVRAGEKGITSAGPLGISSRFSQGRHTHTPWPQRSIRSHVGASFRDAYLITPRD